MAELIIAASREPEVKRWVKMLIHMLCIGFILCKVCVDRYDDFFPPWNVAIFSFYAIYRSFSKTASKKVWPFPHFETNFMIFCCPCWTHLTCNRVQEKCARWLKIIQYITRYRFDDLSWILMPQRKPAHNGNLAFWVRRHFTWSRSKQKT